MPSASSGLVRPVVMATAWLLGRGRPAQHDLLNHWMHTQPICLFYGEHLPPKLHVATRSGSAGQGRGREFPERAEPGSSGPAVAPLPECSPQNCPGSFATRKTQGFCFQLPDPHTRWNQEATQIWGQKEFIDHSFIHPFTRYLLLAHNTLMLSAMTWGCS